MISQNLLTKTLAFILLFFAFNLAKADDTEFSKKFHHEFETDANSIFDISNKYGNINIVTWDQNKIVVDVVITADMSSQEKANAIFEKISIDFSKEAETCKAYTNINGSLKGKFSINYEVKMPKVIALDLENKFGSVNAGVFTGKCNFTVKYGDLTLDKILDNEQKPRSTVNLAYCKNSKVKQCNWLRIDLSYSNLNIEKGNTVMAITKYSNFSCGDVHTVITDSKYDSYTMGHVSNFNCSGQYSNYKIDDFDSRIEADLKYSDIKVPHILPNFESIRIKCAYGHTELRTSGSGDSNVNLETEYGDIKVSDSDLQSEHKYKRDGMKKMFKSTSSKQTRKSISFIGSYSEVVLK